SRGNIVKSASLVVKKVKPVEPAAAQLIRARYGRFLGPQFPVEPGGETSRGVHTNCHRIVPFRIAASGEVEELIDYDVRWRENPAPATAARRSSASFKNNSVLATGTWYKIGITRTGLHRVNRAFLNSL